MIVRLGYVNITNTIDITSSSLVTYTYYKENWCLCWMRSGSHWFGHREGWYRNT